MKNLRIYAKSVPVLILVLAIMAFADSTVNAAREAGYVPIVVATTGTTGASSAGGVLVYGQPPRLPLVADDEGTYNGPIHVLVSGYWYGFTVRWNKKNDAGVAYPPPTKVHWSAILVDPTGKKITDPTILASVVHFLDPFTDDPANMETGRVALEDVQPYSTTPGYYVVLVANADSGGNPSAQPPVPPTAIYPSHPHSSPRLYWREPDAEHLAIPPLYGSREEAHEIVQAGDAMAASGDTMPSADELSSAREAIRKQLALLEAEQKQMELEIASYQKRLQGRSRNTKHHSKHSKKRNKLHTRKRKS